MRKLSSKQVAQIKTLRKKGESERAIARAIGYSMSAVWYQLQKVKLVV